MPTSFSLLILFGCAAVASWLITAGVIRLASQGGILARRDLRRRHSREVPLLGGTAFYVILSAVCAGMMVIEKAPGVSLLDRQLGFALLAGMTMIYVIGVLDDIWELESPPKFAVQFVAAGLIIYARPDLGSHLFGVDFPQWLGSLVLLLWIVGVTNAMNLIDGMDGLCAGIAAISAATLSAAWLAISGVIDPMNYLLVAFVGAAGGFLIHNFHPARIFLGDCGSLLIGYMLAVSSVELGVKRSLLVSIGVPLFLLGLPILDVALAIARRVLQRRSPFRGDRGHLHHRLQRVGLSHRATVLTLWGFTAYLNFGAFQLVKLPTELANTLLMALAPGLGFGFVALHYIERKLSSQVSKFGAFFVDQELSGLANRNQLAQRVVKLQSESVGTGTPFCVISIDCDKILEELINRRPSSVVSFFMALHAQLRGQLRSTDMLGRLSDHRMIVVLPGVSIHDPEQGHVVKRIQSEVKRLQEAYLIFQHFRDKPEGLQVFQCPDDLGKVFRLLNKGHLETPAHVPSDELLDTGRKTA